MLNTLTRGLNSLPKGLKCLNQTVHCHKITIRARRTKEAVKRFKLSPPLLRGLSRKSPTTAPSERVKMNAAKNSRVRDKWV